MDYFAAAGDSVTCSSCDSPSVIVTGFVSKETVAGCRPARVAVSLMVPGISVERMGHAVDAVLGVEIQVVGGVDLALL